jgi:hypothetical protein
VHHPGFYFFLKLDSTVDDGYLPVLGYHVQVIGLYSDAAVLNLEDRHPGLFLDEPHHVGDVAGRYVLDEDECHAGILRHLVEQAAESLQPARGCTNADNRELFWRISFSPPLL